MCFTAFIRTSELQALSKNTVHLSETCTNKVHIILHIRPERNLNKQGRYQHMPVHIILNTNIHMQNRYTNAQTHTNMQTDKHIANQRRTHIQLVG